MKSRAMKWLSALCAMAMSAAFAADNTVTVKATPVKGQVFAGWYTNVERTVAYDLGGVDYRNAQMTYSMPETDALFAKFVPEADDKAISIDCDPSLYYTMNAPMELPVVVTSHSLPTVTAVGMPAGVTFDAKTLKFKGKPTKAGELATVKITAKNQTNKTGDTKTVTIKIGDARSASLPGLHYDITPAYMPFVPGKVQDMTNVLGVATMATLAEGGWTVTGLPAGMTFDSRTGTFKGAPTTADKSYLVTFKKGNEMATITLNTGSLPPLVVTTNVVDAVYPAEVPCTDTNVLKQVKITGAGAFAVGKAATLTATAPKNYVFAGWYEFGMPIDNGSQDFRTASAFKYVMPEDATSEMGRTLSAKFVPASVDTDVGIECVPLPVYAANAEMELPVTVTSHSLPTVTAVGMPAGVTFDAKTLKFKGKPTKAGEAVTVKITAKNLTNKTGATATVDIKIGDARAESLPGLHYDLTPAYAPFVPGLVQDMTTVLGIETMAELAKGGWTVTGLPAGMTFDSRTGTFKGAPSAANAKYLVTFKKGSEMATVTFTTDSMPNLVVTTNVVDAVYPAEVPCTDTNVLKQVKITGAGAFAIGKAATLTATAPKNYVFAGWYEFGMPIDNGSQDFRTASAFKYVMPETAAMPPLTATLSAKFVPASADTDVGIECVPLPVYAANADMELPVTVTSYSLPTVTAVGMPAGVTFDAKTLKFKGKPTKAGESATVKITAKNLTNKTGVTTNIVIKVGDATTTLLPGLKHNDAKAYAAFVPGKEQDMTNVLGVATMATLAEGGWTVTGLPAGMTFDSRTGTFKGAPTVADKSYLVTFKKGSEMATITLNTDSLPTLAVTSYLIDDGDAAPVEIADEAKLKQFKVTGAGAFAVGKSATLTATAPAGYVFAGWFSDATCTMPVENGKQDFRTASGFTYVMPETATPATPVGVSALFRHVAADYARMLDAGAPTVVLSQGDSMQADYIKQAVHSGSKPTVTVKGLPAGITFNATTLLLSGKATDKTAKWYDLVVTAKNASGYSYTGIFGVSVNGGEPAAEVDELGIAGRLGWLDQLKVGGIVQDESSFGASTNGVTGVTLAPAAPEIRVFKETEDGVTEFLVAEVNGEMPVVKTPGVFTATINGTKSGKAAKTTKRFIVRDSESLYERVLVASGCEAMGTVTGNGKVVHPGESFAINATPKAGYTFAGWYADSECTSCAWFMPEVADYRQANQTASTLSTHSFPWGEMVYFNPHSRYAKFIEKGLDDEISIVDPMHPESSIYDLKLLRDGSSDIMLNIVSETLPTVTFTGLPAWMDKDAYEHFDGFCLWYNWKSEPDPGEYSFTMTAKNVGGATATRKITILVENYQNPNLPLNYLEGYTLVPGAAFDAATAMPGANLVGWTVTGLPAGMTFDSKTGTFKGAPTAPDKSYTVWFKKTGEKTATVTMRTKPYPELVLEAEIVDPNETYPELGWAVSIPAKTQFKLTGAGNYQAGKEVTLGATAPTDWVFAGWRDPMATAIEVMPGDMHLDSRSNDTRVAAYKYKMTSADTVTLKGVFIHKMHDYLYCPGAAEGKQFDLTAGYDAGDELHNEMVGTCVRKMFMPLTMDGSFPTVTASGLPAGMKFDAKNLLLSGKITAPSGYYYATFTGKNLSGYTLTVPVRFAVKNQNGDPLPPDSTEADTISASVRSACLIPDFNAELTTPGAFTVGYPLNVMPEMVWMAYTIPQFGWHVGDSRGGYGITSVSGLPAGMTAVKESSSSGYYYHGIEGAPTAAGWAYFKVDVKDVDGSATKFWKHIPVIDDPSRFVEFSVVQGKGTVTGSGVWNSGKTYDVRATPASGYVFAGWFKDSSCTKPAFNWTPGAECDYRATAQKWTLAALCEFNERGMMPRPVQRYAKFVPSSEVSEPTVTSLGFAWSSDPAMPSGAIATTTGSFETNNLVLSVQPDEVSTTGDGYLPFPDFAFRFAGDALPTVTFSGLPSACSVEGPYADGLVVVGWDKFTGTAYPDPGDYNVSMTIKSGGKTAVKNFTLRIGAYPSFATTAMGLGTAYSLDVGAATNDWNAALGLHDANDPEAVGYFTAGSDGYGMSWTWTVTGLPAGLTFNAQSGKITGTVSATTAAKMYFVHFKRTVKSIHGSSSEEAIVPFAVNPLPSWVVGTFYGFAGVEGIDKNEDGDPNWPDDDDYWEWPNGIEVKVAASGAVTATILDPDSTRITVKATNVYRVGDDAFRFDFTNSRANGEHSVGSMTISRTSMDDDEKVPLGYLHGTETGVDEDEDPFEAEWKAYQDAYTAKPAGVTLPMFAAADSTLAIPVSAYSTRFQNFGPLNGTLTLRFGANGAVTPTWSGDGAFTMVAAAHMTPITVKDAFTHATVWVMGYDRANDEAIGFYVNLMIPVSASGTAKASEVHAQIQTAIFGD